ncbi:MAG TPA: S9 family peptidase [Candidatus Saccharimonadales bacterium]|jgi:oligopeptidase B|nr:S9 family peptidase [Candidatus Saccharimonadales bacterium]
MTIIPFAGDKLSGTAATPPVATKVRTENLIHGGHLVDDYRWLREKSDPGVARYLEAENDYADAVMQPTDSLQKKLYDEMISHIKETDDTVPFKSNGYFYYYRWEAGKQYPILARKKGSLAAPEEVTLDVNELAKGEEFMSLGPVRVSEDSNLLAYSTDNTGFRQYRMHVRDLRTGQDLPDTAEKTGSLQWANDHQTLFYTVEDPAKRQYRLYRHKLGSAAPDDILVYEEKDERFALAVEKSRSNKFLFLVSGSHTTSEARYLDADTPTGDWNVIAPRKQDNEYYPDHMAGKFYIRTNDTGRNYRLVSAPIADPDRKNWKEVVPTRADVMLTDFEPFEDFYVLYERESGLPQLTVVSNHGGPQHRISFPEPAYSAGPSNNDEYKTGAFRYFYQSLVSPPSVFDYDVKKHTSTLLKQNEVPGGFVAANYRSERVWAVASDGAQVPVSIVYRKDLKRADGSNPLYVYSYGSYGINVPVNFSAARISLLDRGVVMAYAHIRGGGELGKPWHDSGRMLNKMNTFTDFIAVTEYLVANKYGARDKIAIEGGSAGGLLMGAVTNLRPDLFNVVISHVPFVDVMNTMLDASLPLTVGEYEEWGNPNEKVAYDYMLKYSPYDNLKKAAYPKILVKTSFNDSQVMYWEPAKYVAKLRTLKTDDHPLLLKTNMAAGHGGASGRYDAFKETAFDFAFILTQLGVEK